MKKFFKISIPVLAILLGLTAVFATQHEAAAKASSAQVLGYAQLSSPFACDAAEMCSTEVSDFCTLPNGIRLWDKDASGACVVPLYKID